MWPFSLCSLTVFIGRLYFLFWIVYFLLWIVDSCSLSIFLLMFYLFVIHLQTLLKYSPFRIYYNACLYNFLLPFKSTYDNSLNLFSLWFLPFGVMLRKFFANPGYLNIRLYFWYFICCIWTFSQSGNSSLCIGRSGDIVYFHFND